MVPQDDGRIVQVGIQLAVEVADAQVLVLLYAFRTREFP